MSISDEIAQFPQLLSRVLNGCTVFFLNGFQIPDSRGFYFTFARNRKRPGRRRLSSDTAEQRANAIGKCQRCPSNASRPTRSQSEIVDIVHSYSGRLTESARSKFSSNIYVGGGGEVHNKTALQKKIQFFFNGIGHTILSDVQNNKVDIYIR